MSIAQSPSQEKDMPQMESKTAASITEWIAAFGPGHTPLLLQALAEREAITRLPVRMAEPILQHYRCATTIPAPIFSDDQRKLHQHR
jgi:hypothetical protein